MNRTQRSRVAVAAVLMLLLWAAALTACRAGGTSPETEAPAGETRVDDTRPGGSSSGEILPDGTQPGDAATEPDDSIVTDAGTDTGTGNEPGSEADTGTGNEPGSDADTDAGPGAETDPGRIDLFDLPIPAGEYTLTFENLGELGAAHNVVYFVIDRFDWEYYERAREHAPEIFYNLDDGGFTYFNDAISLYPRTFPSIPYMITGVENDFSESRAAYFASAYGRSEFMRCLYNEGYRINVYTADYYGYINASFLAPYAANAKPASEGHAAYNTDMRDTYLHLTQNGLRIGEAERCYTFIHLSGTHPPIKYDESFSPLPEGDARRSNSTLGMKLSFAIINYYIDEMKRLGVYDSATIIITGDHTSIGSDSAVPLLWPHVTPLFIKPRARAEGALEVSGAPVSHADIFPTVLWSEGISGSEAFGRTAFEIPEGESRLRTYYFQRKETINDRLDYEMVVFEISGRAADYSNWRIRERYYLGKSIYS